MKIFLLAHLLMIQGGGNTLPVIGTPTSALIFALIFTAAVLGLYVALNYLPKVRKNRITQKNESDFAKALIVLLSSTLVAYCWDFWWHQAIGRDGMFIPPHLLIFSSVFIGIGLSFYVWQHSRDNIWKHIIFALLVVIVAAPYDNFWHSIFGIENLSSPVKLAWAPPHVLAILGLIGGLILATVVLLKNRKTSDFSFFGNLALAAITTLILGLLLPFSPTEGLGAIAGFAGTVAQSFAYVGLVLLTQKMMRGRIDGTFMTIFAVLFMLVTYGKTVAPGIIVIPHDRPPVWLFVFAYLFTAILLDITQDRFRMWLRGLFAGIMWSAILYGFSSFFFLPQFKYGTTEIFTAITFAALGGLVAGSLASLHHLTDDKHIEKLLKKF